MGNYTALINDASKLKKYKTEAMKGLGLVGKWNDLWDSDIRCIEACSAFKGNFYVFIGFVLLSYIIIYEVDMTWIYNTLLYAPDIRPFTSIRRNITTKGILKFKLITYIGALVGCWALFRIFSM